MSQKNQDLILEKLEKLNLLDGVVSKLDQLTVTVNAVSSAVDLLAGKVQYNTDNIEFIRQEFDNFKTETRAELRSVKNTLNVREQQLRSAQVRVFNFPVAADDAPPPIGALDTSRGGFRPPRRPRARRRASSPTEIQRYIRVSTAPDHRDRHVWRIGLHARRRNVETLRIDCECQRRREFLRRFVL